MKGILIIILGLSLMACSNASTQYNVQPLVQTDYLNWEVILKEVEKELETIRMEGTY